MSKDIKYGRVVAYIPRHKPRKMINAQFQAQYYIPFSKPPYAYGLTTYLAYESDDLYYRVYNPQRFKFDLDKLVGVIHVSHLYHYMTPVWNFEVVQLESAF